MSNVTLDGLGTVRLDSDGRALGIGDLGRGYTALADLPADQRKEVARRVQIVRHNTILSDNRPLSYLSGWIDGFHCGGHTVEELLDACAARAESVDWVPNPEDSAKRASIVLAADKGIPSHIERNDYDGCDVVTDNGKRFSFRRL